MAGSGGTSALPAQLPSPRQISPALLACSLSGGLHATGVALDIADHIDLIPLLPLQEGQTKILIDRSLADVYNATWTLDGSGQLSVMLLLWGQPLMSIW